MLSPDLEYMMEEALITGASPIVKASFMPYHWPSGLNDEGTMENCSFIPDDRIQATYDGFTLGYWQGTIITSNIQVPESPATITWGWNSPGFDMIVVFRTTDDLLEFDDIYYGWEIVIQAQEVTIKTYYQIGCLWYGFRAWAEDAEIDADEFTAYAIDAYPDVGYDSYASDVQVPGEVLTYIENIILLGEFNVIRDIEEAGSLSMEAPTEFDDLVAGDHSGLLLNNRQGSFDSELIWTPGPLFSPNKSTFFLAGYDWYNLMLKIELGWIKSDGDYTDFVTLFLGKVKKWGPVSRAVDSSGAAHANTVEVYAMDLILDCLNKRIALPADDGTPSPLTFGEFLCKAEEVTGWSPEPVMKSAYFESGNYNELSHVISAGGGVFSLIDPGLTGGYAFRATITGANQSAYGSINFSAGEIFISGTMRITTAPESPSDQNLIFLQVLEKGAVIDFSISVDDNGAICGSLGDPGKFYIAAYLNVPISFALWISPTNPGYIRFWINGDEILAYDANLSTLNPIEVRFGAVTSGVAENWIIDFDDIEIRRKYYHNAFHVPGGPFDSIGAVYIDNIAQPDSKIVDEFTQTLTRYEQFGLVQILSTDPDFYPSGDIMVRVVENAGGRHALYIIEALLESAGLTDYIDEDVLAAAYASCPDDVINARFEGGGDRNKFGLKDFASMGMTVAEALMEITSRCLYWIFIDAGVIKIIPYLASTSGFPEIELTASNKWENSQTIDLSDINEYVTAVYGWYARNPALYYVAGDQEAGGQGRGLDLSWESPVACENFTMVKTKTDNLLKFLSAKELIDPVRMGLEGARIELMTDIVSLTDELLNDEATNYLVSRKDVGLDPGNFEVNLQLIKFLGE